MTLLIFYKCSDGFIIISDRKETESHGSGNEVPKYYQSENDDVYLVLAGSGLQSKILFSSLSTMHDINSQNAVSKISEFIQTYSGGFQTGGVSGFLVLKEDGIFKGYHVEITNGTLIHRPIDSLSYLVGAGDAKVIAQHLLRNSNLENLPYGLASKYLVATVKSVSESASSVGKPEEFGVDVTAFLTSGILEQKRRYTNTHSERVKIEFDVDPDKPIFDIREEET